MRDITTKITGDSLTADEFNDIPSELENAITDTGILLSAGDLFQLSKSISNYVAGGSFYTDSGTSTNYTLNLIGSKQRPTEYFNGMSVSFRAGNNNTTATPTINVAGLGSKNIVVSTGVPLEIDDISTSGVTTLYYDGTAFTYPDAVLSRGPKSYATAAIMVADLGLQPGQTAVTTERHAGTKGGATYTIKTLGDFGGTPDEFGDLTLDNTHVAELDRDDHIINALQYGIIPNSSAGADVTNNDGAKDAALAAISTGGVIQFAPNQYFFSTTMNIDDGQSIIGTDGAVSYRENHDGQVRLTWTTDVDGISYNGFSSYRNALKNLKIDNNLAVDTSTKTGINFTANGGGSTTRALANILDNITVQNFQIGIDPASDGDFSWFREWSNIKIFRCETALIIEGSDGSSQINGLHIDASAGFTGSTVGIDVRSPNGMSISNYSVEGCTNGLVWNCAGANDRLYMYAGYYENNSTADVSFATNSKGQFYSYGSRMAWFSASAKNQAINADAGCEAVAHFHDLTIRGEEAGTDGLIRAIDIASADCLMWFDGLLIQAGISQIWLDFAAGHSPVYIKLLNVDQNSNWIELYSDVLTATDMMAMTTRQSVVTPVVTVGSALFVIDVPGGGSIDLRYVGAMVKGVVPLTFIEWVWNGASWDATP